MVEEGASFVFDNVSFLKGFRDTSSIMHCTLLYALNVLMLKLGWPRKDIAPIGLPNRSTGSMKCTIL